MTEQHGTMGRSIRLFLADGSSTGIIIGEIINWTGQVLKAPRSTLSELIKRTETQRTGVYLLVGPDTDNPSLMRVYVGESDNVARRIVDHVKNTDRDFFESVLLISSKDQNLTKAHVRFLESRLTQIIRREGRAILDNGNDPVEASLPEADVSDMEYFLSQLQLLLPILGLDFTRITPRRAESADIEPKSKTDEPWDAAIDWYSKRKSYPRERPTESGIESPVFEVRDAKWGVSAKAVEIDGQMVVLKGSEAREEEQISLGYAIRDLRGQLKRTGKLIHSRKGVMRFTDDVSFSSPSAASQAIFGTSRNGRSDWVICGSTTTYAEWQESQLDKVAALTADELSPILSEAS